MPVEDVEKLRLEVDVCIFSKEPSFLAYREIFVSASKRSGVIERPGFVAEGERSRDRKRIRIPERGISGVKIRARVGLVYSGDDIYSGDPSEVTPAKQDVAGGTTARSVYRRRKSGLIGRDA